MPTYIGEGGAYLGAEGSITRDLVQRTLSAQRATSVAYLVDAFGDWDDIADLDEHLRENGNASYFTGYFQVDAEGATLNSGMSVALPVAEFSASYQPADEIDINGRFFTVFATDPFNGGDWLLVQIDPM